MALVDEIFAQPQVLRHALEIEYPRIQTIAEMIHRAAIRYVFLAARGTSDNAGLYLKYLFGAYNGLPTALATPSLFTIYERPPKLEGALVIGISQSGQSPDIISVLEEGRRQGCPTLAITNAPHSPLAQTADAVIDIHAGEERAVAATKSYTAQLLAIAMLSVALERSTERLAALHALPVLIEEVLAQTGTIETMAQRYRYMEQCVVLGRGYNYATAFEWALKMKELSYIVAQPYSSADFRHGPIAIVERGFPVLAIAPRDEVFSDLLALLHKLARERHAELVIISNETTALDLAITPLAIPPIAPWLSPLVSIIPAQLFTLHLTRARGLDTEQPRGLRKVTRTR